MTPESLREKLARFPQLPYIHTPSPLYLLPRLTEHLNGPQILIKRDDDLGPGLGGNKGRKLAFIIADVLAKKKRKVVTFGGLQSNHVRMTAAACAALGLEAHLFFFDNKPTVLAANLQLDDLLGAKLHFVPFGGGGDASITLETTNRLVHLLSLLGVGRGSYFMPVGGHTAVGCLGYVAAALEITEQLAAKGIPQEKVTIITAVGTGGTLAGLLAGLLALNSPISLLGLDIGKLWKAFPTSLARLTNEILSLLDVPISISEADVPMLENIYAGSGYAQLTPQTIDAVQLMARTEGVILDPVYTGKAFAGLVDLVGDGRFHLDDTLIFLHTGGLPGLWAYNKQFSKQVNVSRQ